MDEYVKSQMNKIDEITVVLMTVVSDMVDAKNGVLVDGVYSANKIRIWKVALLNCLDELERFND